MRPELVWLSAMLQLARPAQALIHGDLKQSELIQLAGMLRDAGARRVLHVHADSRCGQNDLVALGQAGLDWLVRQSPALPVSTSPLDLLVLAGTAPTAELLSALSFSPEALLAGLGACQPCQGVKLGPIGAGDCAEFGLVLEAPDGLDLWLARRRTPAGGHGHV
jgi:hypothetical protein